MEIVVASLVIFALVLIGMSVGVIFSNKELKGSCGGLGPVMGDECDFCGKKDECDRFQESKKRVLKSFKTLSH